MNAAIPTSPEHDDAYFRTVLLGLVDRGTALAHAIADRALAATPTPENRPEADPTVAFDRTARAVRRCIALARHIAAGSSEAGARPQLRDHARAQTRATLIRGVEDAIHRRRNDADAEQLVAEFTETLEDPALEFDLASRPVAELIEEICRDLGVNSSMRSYAFKRRTPADRTELRTRAAAPARRAAAKPPLRPGPS